MEKERKLCYVLPEASVKTHMKYNVEFVKALGEKGVDVFLIIEKGGSEKFKSDWGVAVENHFPKNVKVYFLNAGNIFSRIIKTLYILTKTRLRGYKKYYVHYSFISSILASISNPYKETYYWNCGIPWQYKRPYMQDLYETFNYKVISHFVTGAKNLTEKYSQYYNFKNTKSIVIPNWIDVDGFRRIFEKARSEENLLKLKKELNISTGDQVLFFNQRLAERKGAHYIKSILENTSSNTLMIITNDGPYKEKLERELKEKDLFERVRMLGRVPNEKVVELLSVTDIYVLPSEEEGMSHSLMEAMCAGVPAVSFDVGGTIDMYPDMFKAYVVEEKNINLFIEKVRSLLSSSEERKRLGDALFEKVKEYDKERVVNMFIEKIVCG